MMEDYEPWDVKEPNRKQSTSKTLKSCEKVKKNGEISIHSVGKSHPHRGRPLTQGLDKKWNFQCVGKDRIHWELAEVLVNKRPLNEIFQELQREEINEQYKDEDLVDYKEVVEFFYPKEGEGIEECNVEIERKTAMRKNATYHKRILKWLQQWKQSTLKRKIQQ